MVDALWFGYYSNPKLIVIVLCFSLSKLGSWWEQVSAGIWEPYAVVVPVGKDKKVELQDQTEDCWLSRILSYICCFNNKYQENQSVAADIYSTVHTTVSYRYRYYCMNTYTANTICIHLNQIYIHYSKKYEHEKYLQQRHQFHLHYSFFSVYFLTLFPQFSWSP